LHYLHHKHEDDEINQRDIQKKLAAAQIDEALVRDF
jgi:hypothetical protein